MSERGKNRHVLEDEASRHSVIKIWEDLGETSICKIQGYSMSPVIRPGDEILVRYGHRNVKKGDIVLLGKDYHSVAHRVVGINHKNSVKTFFCKGDMCSGFEGPDVKKG